MSNTKYVKKFNEFLNEKEQEATGNDIIQEIVSLLEDKGLIKSASEISDEQRKSLREQIMKIADAVESDEGGDTDTTDTTTNFNEETGTDNNEEEDDESTEVGSK